MADDTDAVFEAIKAYLTAEWNNCPIIWPNEELEPPDPPAPFVAFEITGTIYGQQSIGADLQRDNRWDEDGMIMMHVMVPTGTGQSGASGRAKALAKLFRGTRLMNDGLEFLDASIGEGQMGDENGKYFRVTATVDWRLIDSD